MRFLQTPRWVLAWLAIVAGFAVIGGGWVGVQSTPVVAVQLAYLASGGFVGIALVVVGVGLLYQDDLRASRQILEELRDRFDDLEHDVAAIQATLDSAASGRTRRSVSTGRAS